MRWLCDSFIRIIITVKICDSSYVLRLLYVYFLEKRLRNNRYAHYVEFVSVFEANGNA